MSIPRLDLDQAITLIRDQVNPVEEIETTATADAGRRITAEAIAAPMDLPPFANSAMDGYAFAQPLCDPAQPLRIVGKSLAGHPFSGTLGAQQCIRITTGAALPHGADTVIIQEDTEATATHITMLESADLGANVRSAGHDVCQGDLLFAAGERLNPFKVSWLAANGLAQVAVRRKPRVAVVSTGDELIAPGTALGPGQIYDSNRLLIIELLRSLPVAIIDGGCIADDPVRIRSALHALTDADLIITSGGVSVGDADYLTDIVSAAGELDFWRLNLKPGKPLALGSFEGTRYLGLPGNPVSSAVTFLLIARPLILALAGARPEANHTSTAFLTETIRHRPGREEFQRGHQYLENGQCLVTPTGDQSSNRLSSFRKANCLIRLEKDWGDRTEGQSVETLTFDSFI
ncbi:MAG: gephyrin-like molybdotransferase Glp [Pseudomonadales bacterium]